MKEYINNLLYIAGVMMFTILSCSKDGEYSLTETPPLDFKSYYDGLTVSFVNNTENASSVSWNFGDNTPDVAGDSVVHTYAETGNYLITMNAAVNGKSYVFHTILRVDKPSVVSLTDDSFADWDNVTYPDFQLEGQDYVIGGKVDYDANNIYFFLEYETTGSGGLAELDGAIMDLYMDVDNSLATGYSSSIGADLLFEGNIPSEWFDYYRFTGASQGDWTWDYFSMDNAILPGFSETDGDTVRMEFALSREAFQIVKDAFGFRLEIYYSDWSALLGSLAKDNQTTIVMMMNKQE